MARRQMREAGKYGEEKQHRLETTPMESYLLPRHLEAI